MCINRNEKKSEALTLEIENEFGVKCDYKIADLSSLKDIHRVAGELAELNTPIDVLIHNAGIYLTKRELDPGGNREGICSSLSLILYHEFHSDE